MHCVRPHQGCSNRSGRIIGHYPGAAAELQRERYTTPLTPGKWGVIVFRGTSPTEAIRKWSDALPPTHPPAGPRAAADEPTHTRTLFRLHRGIRIIIVLSRPSGRHPQRRRRRSYTSHECGRFRSGSRKQIASRLLYRIIIIVCGTIQYHIMWYYCTPYTMVTAAEIGLDVFGRVAGRML